MAQINATRQELLRLKDRLTTAKKGQKLLEDKRDNLIKEFIPLVKEAKEIRGDAFDNIEEAFSNFTKAQSKMDPKQINQSLLSESEPPKLEVGSKNIMGVQIPQLDLKSSGENEFSYSLLSTNYEFDKAVRAFPSLLEEFVRLGELEHSIRLLAKEIEKTRRRVNILKYVVVPEIKDNIIRIENKLEERERSRIVTLMKLDL